VRRYIFADSDVCLYEEPRPTPPKGGYQELAPALSTFVLMVDDRAIENHASLRMALLSVTYATQTGLTPRGSRRLQSLLNSAAREERRHMNQAAE
jgi:hypothetical protein